MMTLCFFYSFLNRVTNKERRLNTMDYMQDSADLTNDDVSILRYDNYSFNYTILLGDLYIVK